MRLVGTQSQNGSMLVQVLITAGMMTAMALAMAQIFLQQNKQIKYLEQKSETIDLKNLILMTLRNESVCGCNLNPSFLTPLAGSAIVFNGTTANASMNLSTSGLRENCNSSESPFLTENKRLNSNLKIASIQVNEINHRPSGGANDRFLGKLVVGFSNETTMIKLKDISLPIEIKTVQASPGTTNTVLSCKVADDIDVTASCNLLGGTMNPLTGKCVLTDAVADCEALGGTYNVNNTPKCAFPSNAQADCEALGGIFNTSTGKCTLDALASCTSLGGTLIEGKCNIQGALPNNSTSCETTYGAGWVYDATLRTCIPPAAKHKRGDLAGECIQGGLVASVPIPPAKKYAGQCACEAGYKIIIVDPLDSGPEGVPVGETMTITCMKN